MRRSILRSSLRSSTLRASCPPNSASSSSTGEAPTLVGGCFPSSAIDDALDEVMLCPGAERAQVQRALRERQKSEDDPGPGDVLAPGTVGFIGREG